MCSSLDRRDVLCAASLGLAVPLLVDETASAADRPVIATADVPVGGGVVVRRRSVVVTQPTRGQFRVFSTTCTHAGCAVNRVAARRIECPCHGSRFDIGTGAVVAGPASRSLPRRSFRIRRGKIYLT